MSHKSKHGQHRYPTCQMSGKVRFRDRKDAKLALREAFYVRAAERGRGAEITRREVRAYSCPDCHGWHLTSVSRAASRKAFPFPDAA